MWAKLVTYLSGVIKGLYVRSAGRNMIGHTGDKTINKSALVLGRQFLKRTTVNFLFYLFLFFMSL